LLTAPARSQSPVDANIYFEKALVRTPNRPKIVLGLARLAKALGDKDLALKRFIKNS
jgi:hypothetical protein